MTWREFAEALGEHPTELAVAMSLLLSLLITLGVRTVDQARPWLRRTAGKLPFVGERGLRFYQRIEGALGLLVFGLVAVVGGSSLFLNLADAVLANTWLPDIDKVFLKTVHRSVSPAELGFFSYLTPLAGRYPPYVLGVLVGGILLFRRHYSLFTVWVVGLLGNALLSQALKTMFSRQRPMFDNPYLTESNYSFPSGHAMTSVLLYGLLAYIAAREFFPYRPWHRYALISVVVFLGVLIGTSRLVLGVHYPSDVLGGWSVSVVWLSVLVVTAEALKGRFRPSSEPTSCEPEDLPPR